MYDLVIENARLCDGTGAASSIGSLAVAQGRIAAMGQLRGAAARRRIDAEGLVLSPGFIDPHTHYDAQLAWDPMVTCSPLHGVTTVLIGNCGVGVAPVRPAFRETVMQDLVGVEGIALDVMKAGIAWRWETYGEYLDFLDASRLSINVAGLLPMTPLRHYVLGDASFERAATGDEIRGMQSIFARALEDGAFGFSTTLSLSHTGAGGRPVACRNASTEELAAMASTLRSAGKGIVEVALESAGWKLIDDQELEVLRLLAHGSGQPVTYLSTLSVPGDPAFHDRTFAKLDTLGPLSSRIFPQTSPRAILSLCDLREPTLFSMYPSWQPALGKALERQIEIYGSAAFRDQFLQELERRNRLNFVAAMVVLEVSDPALSSYVGRSIQEIAAGEAKRPIDAMMDLAIRDRLATRFQGAVANDDQQGLERLITDDRVILGLSDAGAHNTVLCDAGHTTAVLETWVRERKALTLERAIHKMTGVPASLLGMKDRGRLAVGLQADLALFDLNEVASNPPHFVSDFPAGASRLIATAKGMKSTFVAGREIVHEGEYTGERAGVVLRSGKG